MSNTSERRVVVTGIGVVSPIGIGKDAYWDALAEGHCGIGPVSLFDTRAMSTSLAGEVPSFEPKLILGKKGLRLLDRTTKLALAASALAIQDAGLEWPKAEGHNIGVALGSTMGSFKSRADFFYVTLSEGLRGVNPAEFPNTVVNSPASQISIRFGIRGFNTTIANGFTSSLEAMDYGAGFIRLGRADAVLVGGAEELAEGSYWAFHRTGLSAGTTPGGLEACLPFDRRRNGFIVGEGAAMFMLESLTHARTRDAHIYAEYAGSGRATDQSSFCRYSYRGRGIRKAITRALADAEVRPEAIDCVAAGAHGSLVGDAAEGRALCDLVGGDGRAVWASAVKSMIGEAVSAGGALQAAAGLLPLARGIVPPTIRVDEPDPRCRVDCVAGDARERKTDNVLVHESGPMGQSAAMIWSRARV